MNKLLRQQIKMHFGEKPLPGEVLEFLQVISSSYDQYEKEHTMLEHSIEVSSEEMTKRKEAEKAKAESESKYKELFEKMADGAYKSSHEGRFIEVNPALVNMLGYSSKEELLAIDIKKDLYFKTSDREEAVDKDLTEGISTFMLKRKDGSPIWVEDRGQYVADANGTILYHEGILRDVTERQKAREELERNIAQLKKSNSELDRFVYSVSHDLRAPLSSMLGVIDITLEETKEELTSSHLKMLNTNIKKLDGFIEDILSYSRNSRLEVKTEKINFSELLGEITQNLKFIGGNNRKVEIKVYVNDKSEFHSDKSRLTIILNNLVSNAIRYQNPNITDPFVDIKVDTSDTETNIVVRDNGIGIREEFHEKIFEMFYRVSEESVGSGLGLYLVNEMVSKLNGNIKVNSVLGMGTQFKIQLPNFTQS